MLSAVPLSLAADRQPAYPARRVFDDRSVEATQFPYCGPRDAVLGVTVEVSGATYSAGDRRHRAIDDIACLSARDSGASSAVGGGRLSARACVGHRATSLDGPGGGPLAASARTTPHQRR